jgi:hypothetical protein
VSRTVDEQNRSLLRARDAMEQIKICFHQTRDDVGTNLGHGAPCDRASREVRVDRVMPIGRGAQSGDEMRTSANS